MKPCAQELHPSCIAPIIIIMVRASNGRALSWRFAVLRSSSRNGCGGCRERWPNFGIRRSSKTSSSLQRPDMHPYTHWHSSAMRAGALRLKCLQALLTPSWSRFSVLNADRNKQKNARNSNWSHRHWVHSRIQPLRRSCTRSSVAGRHSQSTRICVGGSVWQMIRHGIERRHRCPMHETIAMWVHSRATVQFTVQRWRGSGSEPNVQIPKNRVQISRIKESIRGKQVQQSEIAGRWRGLAILRLYQ